MYMWGKKTMEHMNVHCGGKTSFLIPCGPLKCEMNYKLLSFSLLSKLLSFTGKLLQNCVCLI